MKDNDQLSAIERLHRRLAPHEYMTNTERAQAVLDRMIERRERIEERMKDFDKKNERK
jgi:hypothetical protein